MPSTLSPRVEIIPPGALSIDEQLAQLDFIADLPDSRFVIPGTNIRFGPDGLIGLIPGIGDASDIAFKSNRRNIALVRKRFGLSAKR